MALGPEFLSDDAYIARCTILAFTCFWLPLAAYTFLFEPWKNRHRASFLASPVYYYAHSFYSHTTALGGKSMRTLIGWNFIISGGVGLGTKM